MFFVAAAALVLACVAAVLWFSPLRQRWATLALKDAVADATPTSPSPSSLPDSSTSAAAAPRTRLQVRGEVVERGDFVVTVQGTGRIEAIQRAELSSRVGERVTQVLVREGDVVRRGQALIELDPAPFDLSWREAQARQQAAKLDFDAALFADTNPSDERRARIAHRTGLTVAEQQLARAQLDRDAATLRAPFDGEVVSVTAAVGERIPAERPLVTLVDRHRVLLAAEVLETAFGALREGALATVTLPAFPSAKLEGRVSALSPEVDPARGAGRVLVELDNRDGKIRPGMYAEAEIAAATYEGRISAPRGALLERSRRLLVFRAQDGRAEWSYVQTGMETADRIEILDGLAPGDTVLVEGHLTLAHGAPIRVSLTSAAP